MVWRLVGGGGFGWLNAIQIPACAGMTVPGGGSDGAGGGVTGGLRGPFDKLRVNGGGWIPAFARMTALGAGMTGGLRGPFDKLRVNGGGWIPACAGMTVPGRE